jgi:hypothetical protein
VLDPTALAELVHEAVAEGLAEQRPPDGLLDLAGICQLLNASAATVSRLRREGMPHLRLGVRGERPWRRGADWPKARTPHGVA